MNIEGDVIDGFDRALKLLKHEPAVDRKMRLEILDLELKVLGSHLSAPLE